MSSSPRDWGLPFDSVPYKPRAIIALIVRGDGYCDVFVPPKSALQPRPTDRHVARTLTFESALAVRRLYDPEFNP